MFRARLIGLLVTLSLCLPLLAQQPPQPVKLLPKDEAAQEPAFLEFRTKLLAAAKKGDKAFIRSILAEDIKLSFGGDEGPKSFESMWQLDNPKTNFWEHFLPVLELGGTFDGDGRFQAPYVFSTWPEDYDPFEHMAVIAEKARLRARPRTDAPVLATLSYDIVKLIDDPLDPKTQAPEGWERVQTLDGQSGYIASSLVRSPIDYRAIFEQRDGRWLMTVFIAGD